METAEGLERRRCTATNREGERCGRAPIPGGTVCVNHGGKAPQTAAAAAMNLMMGRDFAIDRLIRAVLPRPECPHCGRSDADRDPVVVRACQIILDRTGFGPRATLEVEQPEPVVVRRVVVDVQPEPLTISPSAEDVHIETDVEERES